MSISSGRHFPKDVILWAVRWYCSTAPIWTNVPGGTVEPHRCPPVPGGRTRPTGHGTGIAASTSFRAPPVHLATAPSERPRKIMSPPYRDTVVRSAGEPVRKHRPGTAQQQLPGTQPPMPSGPTQCPRRPTPRGCRRAHHPPHRQKRLFVFYSALIAYRSPPEWISDRKM